MLPGIRTPRWWCRRALRSLVCCQTVVLYLLACQDAWAAEHLRSGSLLLHSGSNNHKHGHHRHLSAGGLKSQVGRKGSMQQGGKQPHSLVRPSLTPSPQHRVDFQIGDKVLVHGKLAGTVRYVGRTAFGPTDVLVWYGIELELPMGKNDGSINGVTYFHCASNHGLFTLPKNVATLPLPVAMARMT